MDVIPSKQCWKMQKIFAHFHPLELQEKLHVKDDKLPLFFCHVSTFSFHKFFFAFSNIYEKRKLHRLASLMVFHNCNLNSKEVQFNSCLHCSLKWCPKQLEMNLKEVDESTLRYLEQKSHIMKIYFKAIIHCVSQKKNTLNFMGCVARYHKIFVIKIWTILGQLIIIVY